MSDPLPSIGAYFRELLIGTRNGLGDVVEAVGNVNNQLIALNEATINPLTNELWSSDILSSLNSINGRIGFLIQDTPLVGGANLADVLASLSGLPDVLTTLQYITVGGDGTPLTENLSKMREELFNLGGERPNHATLWDLRDSLVSPTGPRIQEIVEKLDIILYDKLGFAPNALTGLELLQLVADCVCQLNSKWPALPPPDAPTLEGHICAPESADLVFRCEPGQWVQYGASTSYQNTPQILTTPASVAFYRSDVPLENSELRPVIVAEIESADYISEFSVTSNKADSCWDIVWTRLYQYLPEPTAYWVEGALLTGVTNPGNFPSGCRPYETPSPTGNSTAFTVEARLKVGRTVEQDDYLLIYYTPV